MDESRRQPGQPLGRFAWPDVVLGFATAGLLPATVTVAWMFAAHRLGGGSGAISLGILIGGVVMVLAVGVLSRCRGWTGPALGLSRPSRSLWHLLWETPTAIGLSLVCAGLLRLLMPLDSGTATDGSLGIDGLPIPAAALIVVTTVILVPAAEEVVFRGVLYGWLRGHLPTVSAVVAAGAIFGLVHVAPAAIAYVLPLGLFLTAIRVWHGSILASFVVHAVNNGLVTVVALSALAH